MGAILEEPPSTEPQDLDRNPLKLHRAKKRRIQEGYVKILDFDYQAMES